MYIWVPTVEGSSIQTRWFYERARGQYKNARLKDGFTKSRQKAFDIKNPKSQMFTKEDLAKYINSYEEVIEGKKTLTGPHFVVRGNQKNYVQFMNYNIPKKIDNIYFEDLIAKAILFRSAEKAYGIKPNAIGDMRYITVPYSISLLNYMTDSKLNLYNIWRKQSISSDLRAFLYELMVFVEKFIKRNAPGSLYGEWAKKDECWLAVKNHNFNLDVGKIKTDLDSTSNNQIRKRITIDDTVDIQVSEETNKIKSVPSQGWRLIEEWGKTTGLLSTQQQNIAWNIGSKIRSNNNLSDIERKSGIRILDIVIDHNPEMLLEIDENQKVETDNVSLNLPISLNTLLMLDKWQKENKKLDWKDESFYKGLVKNLWEPKGGQIIVLEKIIKKAIDNGFIIQK